MQMKIYIESNKLAAAALFAAKSDVRSYLIGVLIEANALTTRVMGTDGHVLLCAQSSDCKNDIDKPVSIVIPADVLKAVKPDDRIAHLSSADNGKTWELATGNACGSRQIFAPIDGRSPDYRRVLPDVEKLRLQHFDSTVKSPKGPRLDMRADVVQYTAQIDPELLVKFAKAGRMLTGKRDTCQTYLHHTGLYSAVGVTIGGRDDVYGVIMPVRMDSPEQHEAAQRAAYDNMMRPID
jgi:hypothetical protein